MAEKIKVIINNRQAFRDFHIDDTYEAGLELFGNEVKSLRGGNANLKGSFAKVEKGQVYIYNMHITPYEFSREETDPVRPRKLLLHKTQIRQIEVKLLQKGFSLIPIKAYFKRGYAKVELGIGRGKKLYDKRHDIKKKQADREMQKALRHRNR